MDDNECLTICISSGRNRRSFRLTRNTDFIVKQYCQTYFIRPPDAEESVNDTYYPPEDPAPQTPAVFHLPGKDHPESGYRPLAEEYRRKAGEGGDAGAAGRAGGVRRRKRKPGDGAASQGADRLLLNRFLRKLPEKDRTVFLLRYYYAGTKDDIARKTGLLPIR